MKRTELNELIASLNDMNEQQLRLMFETTLMAYAFQEHVIQRLEDKIKKLEKRL